MLHDAAGKILRRFHGLGVMSSCWEGLSGQPDLLLCGEVVSEVPPLFVDENAAKSQNTLGPVAAPAHPGTVESNADAGGLDAEGREALLRYVLRPPLAQERVEVQKDGLVRISLKRAFADGTVAVEVDVLDCPKCHGRMRSDLQNAPNEGDEEASLRRRSRAWSGDGTLILLRSRKEGRHRSAATGQGGGVAACGVGRGRSAAVAGDR